MHSRREFVVDSSGEVEVLTAEQVNEEVFNFYKRFTEFIEFVLMSPYTDDAVPAMQICGYRMVMN